MILLLSLISRFLDSDVNCTESHEKCFECKPNLESNQNVWFPNYKLCDEVEDCKDKSDEYNCTSNFEFLTLNFNL